MKNDASKPTVARWFANQGLVAFGANLWLLLYPFLMFRRLFANSWPKTILKTGLLGLGYFLTLALAFALTGFIIFAAL